MLQEEDWNSLKNYHEKSTLINKISRKDYVATICQTIEIWKRIGEELTFCSCTDTM
jgi:hypothetical protein